jgi:hypothetical protein
MCKNIRTFKARFFVLANTIYVTVKLCFVLIWAVAFLLEKKTGFHLQPRGGNAKIIWFLSLSIEWPFMNFFFRFSLTVMDTKGEKTTVEAILNVTQHQTAFTRYLSLVQPPQLSPGDPALSSHLSCHHVIQPCPATTAFTR